MRTRGRSQSERDSGETAAISGSSPTVENRDPAKCEPYLKLFDPSPESAEPTTTIGAGKRMIISGLLIPALVAGGLSLVMLQRAQSCSDFSALASILKENQGLEWAQVGVLVLSSSICWGAFRPGNPVLHRALALVPLLLALRELDALFRNHISEMLHRVLMGSMAAGLAFLACRHRRELVGQIRDFTRRPGFYHILFGFSLVAIYAQILGQRDLWDMLGKNGPYGKRFVEEGLELFGYVSIACGICEERFFGMAAHTAAMVRPELPATDTAVLKKAA